MTARRITRTLVVLAATAALAAGIGAHASAAAGPSPAAVAQPQRTDFGFLKSAYTSAGTTYVRFDRAVMLTGAAARAAKIAHGLDPNDAPDYYIQNDNPRVRTLALASGVKVYGSQALTGSPATKQVSLQTLLTYLSKRTGSAYPPFVLRYGTAGKVVSITEQYLA